MYTRLHPIKNRGVFNNPHRINDNDGPSVFNFFGDVPREVDALNPDIRKTIGTSSKKLKTEGASM